MVSVVQNSGTKIHSGMYSGATKKFRFRPILQSGTPIGVPLSRHYLRHRNKIEFRYVDDAFSRSPRRDVQRAHFRVTDNE